MPRNSNTNNANNHSFTSSFAAAVAPAFKLPPAVWLPHTSWFPFTLQLVIVLALLNGGYVAFHYLATFEIKWWMTGAWLAGVTFLVPLFVQFFLVRRINFLSAVVQQDPRLVAGDAVAFNLLKTLPCCLSSREADTLQKSLVNLYRASFRGRSVIYDGGFSRRSVISCDGVDNEQRLLASDAASDDGYYSDDGGGGINSARGGWETPPDPFQNSSAKGSPVGSFDDGRPPTINTTESNVLLDPHGNNIGGGRSPSSAPRRSGLGSASAAAAFSGGGGGGMSLQRALLLSGVSEAEAAAAGVISSNPNTPRGSSLIGGNSYGTAASSMVSARSHRSVLPSASPDGSELGSFVNGERIVHNGNSQQQQSWMLYDPLGDNNSQLPYEVMMRGVPDPGSSLLVSLVRQISPGTPLSAVTFPVHILEPRSLLEKFADVFRHAQILVDAASEPDPDIRIRHVAKFYLSAYYLQLGARKPYNPIHGECFGGRVELPQSGGKVVYFLAEQVSHHPPVTFIRAVCPGVFSYRAVYHAKTSLVSINCASSVGEGGIELELFPPQAAAPANGTATAASSAPSYKYTMSWPVLYVSGFLYGSMRLELGGTTTIVEHNNPVSKARAQIDFARKGWISGEYDVVRCHFADSRTGHIDEKHGPVLDGKWNGVINFCSDVSQLNNPGSKGPIWNGPAMQSRMGRLVAVNVASCPQKQSRAIWQRLTQALRQQQVPKAVEAKHEVEQAQRAWRKGLADRGEKHVPIHFVHKSGQSGNASEIWDLNMWYDAEATRQFFSAQVADVVVVSSAAQG